MMCLYLCLHYVHVYLTNMCLSSNVYVIVTTIMKGVISYFPSPGVVRYVVSICIPSEQEFGGSVEIRRSYTAIPNETECKDPVLLSMPA
jgi:hypothetical protein